MCHIRYFLPFDSSWRSYQTEIRPTVKHSDTPKFSSVSSYSKCQAAGNCTHAKWGWPQTMVTVLYSFTDLSQIGTEDGRWNPLMSMMFPVVHPALTFNLFFFVAQAMRRRFHRYHHLSLELAKPSQGGYLSVFYRLPGVAHFHLFSQHTAYEGTQFHTPKLHAIK